MWDMIINYRSVTYLVSLLSIIDFAFIFEYVGNIINSIYSLIALSDRIVSIWISIKCNIAIQYSVHSFINDRLNIAK